ncbi:MAG: hypothetical protein QXX84_06985 [Sulfolobales archaeon]
MVGFKEFLKIKTTGGYLEKHYPTMKGDRLEKLLVGLENEYMVGVIFELLGYQPKIVHYRMDRQDIDYYLGNLTISVKTSIRGLETGNVILELGNRYKKGWFYTSRADIWVFVVGRRKERRVFWDYASNIRVNAFLYGRKVGLSEKCKEINKVTGFRGVRDLEGWTLLLYPIKHLKPIWGFSVL